MVLTSDLMPKNAIKRKAYEYSSEFHVSRAVEHVSNKVSCICNVKWLDFHRLDPANDFCQNEYTWIYNQNHATIKCSSHSHTMTAIELSAR